METAGDEADCLWYLMGDHLMAERMYRHDPRAMLYAPLRTVISEDRTGGAWFTRELAALLQDLDVDVPEALPRS
jgi:hypothetical protein